MSEEFSRKFAESSRLASRSLPEIKDGLEDAVTRLKRPPHRVRVGGEPFSLTGAVNAVLAWWLSQPVDLQNEIALAGASRCNELLKSEKPASLLATEPRDLGVANVPLLTRGQAEAIRQADEEPVSVKPTSNARRRGSAKKGN